MNASAEALAAPPLATPHSAADGEQFVINLCSSTTPMALVQAQNAELRRFTFFVSRRREEGRERFRLHMGYFNSAAEAEEWLNVVRDVYPAAWVGEAPGKKLRAAAAAAREAATSAGNAERTPDALPPLPTLEVPALSAHARVSAPVPAVAGPAVTAAPAAARAPAPNPAPKAAPAAKPMSAPIARAQPASPARAPARAPAGSPHHTDTLSNVREVIAALDADPAPRGAGAPAFVPTVQAAAVQVRVPPKQKSAGSTPKAAAMPAKPANAQPKAPARPQPAVLAKAQATAPARAQVTAPAKAQATAPARPQPAAPAKAQATAPARPQPAAPARAPATAGSLPPRAVPAKPAQATPARAAPTVPVVSGDASAALSDSQVLRVLEERGIAQAHGERDLTAESAITMLRPEDTQTLRALKNDVRENAPAQFAVQLAWSVTPIDLAKLPPLAIFSAYTLYTIEASREGRRWFGLRLGFFTDAISAKQVAYYVRSDFASVAVVPVSSDEKSRATHESHDATEVGKGARGGRKSAEEFKLFDLEPAADQADPAKGPVPAQIAAAARAGLAAARTGAAVRGAAGHKPSPRPLRKKAPSESLEQTLEQTLEILGAGDLTIDTGRGELLNDTGVRHLSVKLDKRTSTFSKLLDRLSDRLGGR